jgi:hypothetical protein
MFETPGAANVTLDTLANIAAGLRVGLVVEFVPFSRMLDWENHYRQDLFDVTRIEQDEAFLNPHVDAETEDSNQLAGSKKGPRGERAGADGGSGTTEMGAQKQGLGGL